ncbi:MAG: FlgD immunoglobulin-like domain containing protein [Candidatus Latescibacterota bacterium]
MCPYLGGKVRTLFSGPMSAGGHTVTWDGRDDSGKPVASGVYISRLVAGERIASGKMVLLK